VEINPQAGEYYDRMLDCITRKKQLFNEATASNSASIDTDCGVRHTLGIQLPDTEMQIETRDVNKSRCVLFFSWWPLLQRSTSKNSSQHWDFEGSLEGEYVGSSPVRKHRGARRRRPVQKRREKERRRKPPAAGRLAPCVGRTAFRRRTNVSVFTRIRTHTNGYRIRGQIRIPYVVQSGPFKRFPHLSTSTVVINGRLVTRWIRIGEFFTK
jgi:hypothetical protein